MEKPFNIVQLFLDAAARYPDKVAIVEGKQSIRFEDLDTQIKRTADYFIHKGIKKGDRVMIFVPMGIDLYRIVLALFRIGATAVFLDEWVSRKRMQECCNLTPCAAFIGIFKARIAAFLLPGLRSIPIHLGTRLKHVPGPQPDYPTVTRSDTALITFTTGSTGIPKAAKRTHGFLEEQFKALIEKINPHPDDIDMPVLPIVLMINLGIGCTSVIAKFKASRPETMDAKSILKQIRNERVTRIVSSPFFIKQLARTILATGIQCPGVKKIFTGGAPVFPSEALLYSRGFPDTQIEIVYGSTEAEPISSIDARTLVEEGTPDLKSGLNVGIPYHKAQIKIIQIKNEPIACSTEDELNRLVLKPGLIGEIIVSGPHVLREYINNELAMRQNKIFVGSTCWHRTGDSGYLDQEGKLMLTGRCNTLITRENSVIAPFIYEHYFSALPEIEMGTILEVNNKIFILLELKKKARAENLKEVFRAARIPFDEVRILNKIPRDPRHHSKVNYDKLKSTLRE